MITRSVALGSCLALALGVTGCQDPVTAPAVGTPAAPRASESAVPEGLVLGAPRLPSSARVSHRYFVDATGRAIDGTQYACPAEAPPVVAWYGAAVNNIKTAEPAVYATLQGLATSIIPAYEALLFQTPATPQTFGYAGEYTDVMLKTEKDVKRFWDIRSDDIQLLGMHGTVLLDPARTAPTYAFAFGLPPATAGAIAGIVRSTMLASTTVNGGNHPYFSFNAFAVSAPELGIADKIIMGDGIMAGFAAVGFGDVAPQAIYAHEFAHQIQFENGYFEDAIATAGDEAESTRYTELMADAMSAYVLTHKLGAAMNRKRVQQFLSVFFQIGDCAFENPGHHGTPNQRMAAARFGFDLAARAQKQGFKLTSGQVYAEFVKAYPGLIAPDAL